MPLNQPVGGSSPPRLILGAEKFCKIRVMMGEIGMDDRFGTVMEDIRILLTLLSKLYYA